MVVVNNDVDEARRATIEDEKKIVKDVVSGISETAGFLVVPWIFIKVEDNGSTKDTASVGKQARIFLIGVEGNVDNVFRTGVENPIVVAPLIIVEVVLNTMANPTLLKDLSKNLDFRKTVVPDSEADNVRGSNIGIGISF